MIVHIQPSRLSGTITAPASKSAMQRACAAALIRKGRTVLTNPGISSDDKAALGIITQLGAKVQEAGGEVIVESKGIQPISGKIYCGESGLSVRMFTPLAATASSPIHITGSGSLVKRPLSFFDEVLPGLGVSVRSEGGLLPLEVQGPLEPRNIDVDGSLSSQFLTGLLMAFAAQEARDVTISVKGLASKPYIDLTLEVMKQFGLKTPVHKDYEHFHFDGNSAPAPSTGVLHFAVEGDWSGAAFLLVAGAISGEVIVKGLDAFSVQADKAVLQALMQAGANISIEAEQVHVRESKLKAFHFNATQCPDLFPPLAVLAAYSEGTSVIEGVGRLTHKESNRALTIQEELGKLGVDVRLQDDLMIIEGGSGITGGTTTSHGDHRIAMACAVAALKASGKVTVEGAEAVSKSYPQFWDHMAQLQLMIEQD